MKLEPPRMAKKPREITVHGKTLVDDYFWFRDISNPEVMEHLKKENEYVEAVLAPTRPLQDQIYKEIVGRIKQEDVTYPVKIDDYYYYSRVEEGKEHRIHCRRKGSMEAPEEIILDVNKLAEGKDYIAVGVIRPSPDHKILAYSVDFDGSEKYLMHFKDLTSGTLLPDQISQTHYSAQWFADGQHIIYTKLNDKLRPDQVWIHRLGTNPETDRKIYQETDTEFFIYISKSRNRELIFVGSLGKVTSEYQYLKADQPDGPLKMINPRQHGVEYSVYPGANGRLFILTNWEALNFRLMETSINAPTMENWRELIPHDSHTYLTDVDEFENFLVITERSQGIGRFRVMDLKTQEQHHIEMPEPIYQIYHQSLDDNPDFKTQRYRFYYSSLTTPETTYEYDVVNKTLHRLKVQEVPTFHSDLYVTERIFAKGHDGVDIPISVLRRKDTPLNGTAPCYLNGYGSYGFNMPVSFRQAIFSLVDRGFVFAIAHVRGGADMGRSWYEDGKFLKKKNTFYDFISCAEKLISDNYTKAGQIVISGGSAGGLLVGATVNLRPELFKAVVAHVPFVDVINTMLDDTLPLTTIEYEEWGNPNDKTYFDYMLSYSPYDNVERKAYPHFFVTAGLNDPRVTYWEPAKWVAKLRELKTDNNLVLFYINMGAGHGGKTGRFERYREDAMEYAFLVSLFDPKSGLNLD